MFSHSVMSWDPTSCNLPGSSVQGTLQARILQWVAISFSRGSSQPRDLTKVFCIAGRFFTHWATREACYKGQDRDLKKTDTCRASGEGWPSSSRGSPSTSLFLSIHIAFSSCQLHDTWLPSCFGGQLAATKPWATCAFFRKVPTGSVQISVWISLDGHLALD